MNKPLLALQDVKIHFPVGGGGGFRRRGGVVRAVDGVSLEIREGEVLGLVGESGCGKSTLARGIVQLAPVTSGEILFQGQRLNNLPRNALRRLRPSLQMIFQDPYASLNPRMTVFDTLAEPMLVHGLGRRRGLPAQVSELMGRVGLEPRFMRKYPHEFSGGQRQRIAIARALALEPRLILADEPVSALDVSVQAQILNLLARLVRETGLTLVLISHDLAVVKHIANRIAVMYLGRIVELGGAAQVFERPRHPYTQALLDAIPLPDPDRERERVRRRLSGETPSPVNPPSGCPFHPRCPRGDERCRGKMPALVEVEPGHSVACWNAREDGASSVRG